MAYIGRRRDPQRPPALPDPGVGVEDKFGTELTNPQYSGFTGLPDPGAQVTDQAGNITYQNPQYAGGTSSQAWGKYGEVMAPGAMADMREAQAGFMRPVTSGAMTAASYELNEALAPWWNQVVADLDALDAQVFSHFQYYNQPSPDVSSENYGAPPAYRRYSDWASYR